MTTRAPTTASKTSRLHVPFDELVGLRLEHWERGRSVVTVERRAELTNALSTVHGAVIMALLDAALCKAAAHSEADPVITVNLSVSFVSAAAGKLVAEGRMIRGGKSLVFCEGEVRAEDGTMVAKAVGTFKLPRSASGS